MIRTSIVSRRVRRSATVWASAGVAALAMMSAVVSAPQARALTSFDVLQLNLCGSGQPGCGAGAEKSARSAIAVIKDKRPDVVTLNGVCARDITNLSMATSYRWAFEPASQQGGGAPYQCPDGRGDFGVALLTHPDSGAPGDAVVKRAFRAQDGGHAQRVMLCAPYSRFSACTTHLSPSNATVAVEQCRELAGVVAGFRRPTIVGGDFNLSDKANPNVRDCVPGGWFRDGDGGVQHVMATDADFNPERTENLPIEGTVHPGLLVELTW